MQCSEMYQTILQQRSTFVKDKYSINDILDVVQNENQTNNKDWTLLISQKIMNNRPTISKDELICRIMTIENIKAQIVQDKIQKYAVNGQFDLSGIHNSLE